MARECSQEKTRQMTDEEGKIGEIYVPKEEDDSKLFESAITSGINFDKFESIPVRVTGGSPPPAIKSFATAGLRPLLLENIDKSGYKVPTPVQKRCLPIVMSGHDLITCSQTGSGKTAAFLLPILHKLMESQADNHAGEMVQAPQCLVITPTRELAMQIKDEARKFSMGSMMRCVAAYGGTSVEYQFAQLQKGCNVLIATPGRLMDFVDKGKVSFESLKYLVLDEADRMLDIDFMADILRCMDSSSMPGKGERQTLMFSTTFPDQIQTIAQQFLTENYLFVAVGVVGGACADVTQEFHEVAKDEKREKLMEILQGSDPIDKTMVFVQTTENADFIATHLSGKGLSTTSIHGNRFQREREEALNDFRTGAIRILVATTVAVRGLDIKRVAHVINFDMPEDIDEYVHRIGRTGRVGNTGKATSFYDAEEDFSIARPLVQILTECGQEVPGWLAKAATNAQADGEKSKGGTSGVSKMLRAREALNDPCVVGLEIAKHSTDKQTKLKDFENSKIIVNPFLKKHYIDKNGKMFVESLDKALRIAKNGDSVFLKNGEHDLYGKDCKMATALEKNVTIIGESTNKTILNISFQKSIMGEVQFRRLKIQVGFPIHVEGKIIHIEGKIIHVEGKISFESCILEVCSDFCFFCFKNLGSTIKIRNCFVEVYNGYTLSINRASHVLIESTKFILKKGNPSSFKPGLHLENIERVEIANTIVSREGNESTLACLRTYLEKQPESEEIDDTAILLVTVQEATIRDSIFKGFYRGITTKEVNKVNKICFTGVYNCQFSNMAVCVLLDSHFTSRSIVVLSDISLRDSLVGVRVSEICHNGSVDVLDAKFINIASPIVLPKVLKQDASGVKDEKKNFLSRLEMKNITFPDGGHQNISRKKRRDDFIRNLMKAGVLDSTVSIPYLEPIFKPKGNWLEIANEKDMEPFTSNYQSDNDDSVD